MKRFEKLSDREQGKKLVELEQLTVRLVADEFPILLWGNEHTRLPAGPVNSGVTPNRMDRVG